MFGNVIDPVNSPKMIRNSHHLISNIEFSKLDYWQLKIIYALVVYIAILIAWEVYGNYEKSLRKNEVNFQQSELQPYF